MSHKITKWYPDTCGCEINIIWNDTDPNVIHEHKIINACSRHIGLTGDNVLAENQKKNRNINKVIEVVPENLRKQVSFSVSSDGEIIIHVPTNIIVSLDSGVKVNLIQ